MGAKPVPEGKEIKFMKQSSIFNMLTFCWVKIVKISYKSIDICDITEVYIISVACA